VKPPGVRYVAVIAPVREVILAGSADLAWWRERLGREALHPYDDGGRASLLLSATASSFRGLPFREFSVSVAVSERADGATHDGVYLAQAYNSSRLLAFTEQLFFRTPYVPAGIQVTERPPVTMAVSRGEVGLFAASLAEGTPRANVEAQEWEGPIFLPGGKAVFYARLAGATDVYPFTTADTVSIRPDENDEALRQLVECGFVGREWRVRATATHARTRTHRRNTLPF